jgi:hypothetical protein
MWGTTPSDQREPRLAFHAARGVTVANSCAVSAGITIIRSPSISAIWEIYERLSAGHALLPTSLAFSFDRELRDNREILDLQRRSSSGRVKFLPRRTYENYLVEPNAIAAVINAELEQTEVTGRTVSKWLGENAHRFCSAEHPHSTANADWMRYCDAS